MTNNRYVLPAKSYFIFVSCDFIILSVHALTYACSARRWGRKLQFHCGDFKDVIYHLWQQSPEGQVWKAILCCQWLWFKGVTEQLIPGDDTQDKGLQL